ncbi:HNH endonuclease [Eikenella sp. Marseille-P7795]|nr:HNH endonuclease [Eikenella sp. Marseille-P7795]
MAKARIGHAKFREELMKYWDNKCAVLGAENPKSGGFLIASHIVPWSEANKIDKVNPFNGLLLSPHLDRLFDSGYISFDDEGVIIYKPEYQYLLQQMSIPLDAKLRKLNKNKHLPFLQRHREIYGFK